MQIDPIVAVALALVVTGVIVLLSVTHARRVARLAASHDHLATTAELAEAVGGVGAWTLDCATSVVTWSDAVFTMHGRSVSAGVPALADAIGYYHPQDREMVNALVGRAVEHGDDFDFVARIIGDDGVERTVISRGACEIAPDGIIRTVYGSIVDVSLAVAWTRRVMSAPIPA